MENKRLKLPIGIQTFEKLRKKKCVYVDKTKYLVDLIDNIDVSFLARPRRFGKSLTVSTLEALLSGKKELFKGLYAEEYMNRLDFTSYPVIRLDMSGATTHLGIDVIDQSIKQLTIEIADSLDVEVPKELPGSDFFRSLIVNTAKKYNQKVAVLIDEYDAPYTDFFSEPEMAIKVRNVLRSYYKQLKVTEAHIRFIFITGISKFAKLGVFSALNNTIDISLMPEYAKICGYTEDEIIRYFPDYIDETAKYMEISPDELIEKMRFYYNGFSFDHTTKTRLYNPFSTLLFFFEKEFFNYWVDTGRSKIIADYLKDRNLTVEQFRNYPISRDFAKSPGDVDSTTPEGFLYQCGYLTLRAGTSNTLSLDYPNTEVLNSMSALLTQNIVSEASYNNIQNILLSALMYEEIDNLVDVFNRLFASIPYDDFESAGKQSIRTNRYPISVQEWLYRSTLIAFLRGCGVVVFAEMHTNLGRADLVISHKSKTWIIEIKVAYKGDSPAKIAEEAYRQIIDKNYAKPYIDAICVGMAIDDTLRQITDVKSAN